MKTIKMLSIVLALGIFSTFPPNIYSAGSNKDIKLKMYLFAASDCESCRELKKIILPSILETYQGTVGYEHISKNRRLEIEKALKCFSDKNATKIFPLPIDNEIYNKIISNSLTKEEKDTYLEKARTTLNAIVLDADTRGQGHRTPPGEPVNRLPYEPIGTFPEKYSFEDVLDIYNSLLIK